MKTISSGTLIINEYNEILVGVVTLQNPTRYDIPKGMIEDNETAVQAAIRECKEEFGYDLDQTKMIDIGHFVYNSQKNLHLFKVHVNKNDIDLEQLKCSTTFSLGGRDYPEVNGYLWFKISQIDQERFAKSMCKVLNKLIESGVISNKEYE